MSKTLTLQVPDDVVAALAPRGDALQQLLEAVALEGYRSGRLTEAQVRRLLGYETRVQVHGFLKDHGVFLPYTMDDLELEREAIADFCDHS